MYNEFKSPYFTPEKNLEIAIGGVMFRDEVILNLRKQIINLRELCLSGKHNSNAVDAVQFKHLTNPN